MAPSPRRLILAGFVLVTLGFVIPLLMVISVLESTLLLNFVAYGASISGLFLGVIGTMQIVKRRKHKREDL